MITESDRYKAQLLQRTGFAFMVPFGTLIIKYLVLEGNIFSIRFVLAFIGSLILVYFGIIIALRGIEILKEVQ